MNQTKYNENKKKINVLGHHLEKKLQILCTRTMEGTGQ